jgi:hypothetical protein
MCTLNEVPYVLLDADPADTPAWVAAMREAIDSLLGARRPTGR